MINQLSVISFLQDYLRSISNFEDSEIKYRRSIKGSGFDVVEKNMLEKEIKYIKYEMREIVTISKDDDVFIHFASLCKDMYNNEDLIINKELINELKNLYIQIDSNLGENSVKPKFWDHIYFRLLSIENRLK